MSRIVIVGSMLALASVVVAVYSAEQDSAESLDGKYVSVYTATGQNLVLRSPKVRKLGDRSFMVAFVDSATRPHYSYIPIDSVRSLEVYDTLEAATGKVIQSLGNVKCHITLNGKPLAATVSLQSDDGLVYAMEANNNGHYEVKNVPTGSYTVAIDSDFLGKRPSAVKKPPMTIEVKSGQNAMAFGLVE